MRGEHGFAAGDGNNPVDARVEAFARMFAQGTRRRSVLGWAGKVLVGLAGAGSLYPLLPVDRRVATVSASHDCGFWKHCGMDGRPCSQCGGTDNTCPSACNNPSTANWVVCCWNPGNGCYYYITYKDCCGGRCTQCSDGQCDSRRRHMVRRFREHLVPVYYGHPGHQVFARV
jgi:methylamine dehydrogenase light chain